MKILFNNLSLETNANLSTDFAASLSSFIHLIKEIEKDYDVYVDKLAIHKFEKEYHEFFEEEALSIFTLFKNKINNLITIDLDNSRAEDTFYITTNYLNNYNVSFSVLAYAFQRQKEGEKILLLNALDNEYSLRNFVPLFIAKHLTLCEYQNIPCFDTAQHKEIAVYAYCMTTILPILDTKHKEKITDIINTYIEELHKLPKIWKLSFDYQTRKQTIFPMQKVTTKIVQCVEHKGNSTKIEQLAAIIAKINGWEKDKERSKINHKPKGGGTRDVYKPKNTYQGAALYISVDTEKGDFEVHNEKENDNHLGAISFDCQKYEKLKGHKLYHP